MPSDQRAHGLELQTEGSSGAVGGTGGEFVLHGYCSGDGGRTKERGHIAISKQVSLSIRRLALNSLFYIYGKSCTLSLA